MAPFDEVARTPSPERSLPEMRPFEVSATTLPVTSSSSMRPLLVCTSTSPTSSRSIAPFEVEPRTSTPEGTSIV